METYEQSATWDQRQVFQQRLHNCILRYQQAMEEMGNMSQAAAALDSAQGEVLGWIIKQKDKDKDVKKLQDLADSSEKALYIYSIYSSFPNKHSASKAVRKWYFELCAQMHKHGLIMQSMKNNQDMYNPMNVG